MKMWIQNIIDVSFVIVGLLTIVYLYNRRQFSFWAKKDVPFKKPHFLFGSFADAVKRKTPMIHVLRDLYNGFKGERFCGVWEMFKPSLLIIDPNLAQEILVKDFNTWPNRGRTLNPDVDPLSEHLANIDGPKWKYVRTKLTPTFTSAKLKNMYDGLLECVENLEKYFDTIATSNKHVETMEISAKFTTDVIGSCVFGIQMNSLNNENALFRKMGRKIFQWSISKHVIHLVQTGFPRLFKLFKLSTTPQDVTKFFLKITKETMEYRDNINVQKNDFIDLLKTLRNPEFNDNLLAAQAFIFFAAGFETSSSTIGFCLHELAVNQDIQNRLRDEVHRTKLDNNGEISWDTLKNMNYLDMVVKETLRKYPVIPQLQRTSVKPYSIPDTKVELPAGIKVIIPLYALHHDPEYFPDPEKFNPDRFTDEAKIQRPPFAYIPFGSGPRVCIGLRFAEQQTKIALAKAVDTFKFSLCEKSQHPIKFKAGNILLQPEVGIWLKISRNNVGNSNE